jgi:hypothetical protein
MDFEVQLLECEKQKELVQVQQTEIGKLQGAGLEFERKIMTLEKEKKGSSTRLTNCDTLEIHISPNPQVPHHLLPFITTDFIAINRLS